MRFWPAHFTAENLKAESEYFGAKGSKSFERPYGWAWLLKLAEELHGWDDTDAKGWSKNFRPLADVIVARYLEFFPKQTYPIRTGVHPNTAFGLSFAHDFARAAARQASSGIGRRAGAHVISARIPTSRPDGSRAGRISSRRASPRRT